MFLNRLTELMKKNNLTKASLARLSGIPYTTIDGFFKKGYENTKLSTLKQLSSFFNVSLDYLVAQDNITDNLILTDKHEKYLIENYRNLSEQGKEYILKTMELVKDRYKKETDAEPQFEKEQNYKMVAWGGDNKESEAPKEPIIT